MKKENFQDQLIKRFYGIAGPLDEFRKKEALRLGNVCFVLFFWGFNLVNLLALALSKRFSTIIAYGYPVLLLISALAINQYLFFRIGHKQLDSIDIEDLSPKEQKSLKGASIKFALYFTVFMYAWNTIFSAWMDRTNPLENLFNPQKFFAASLGGIFIGIALKIMLRKRIRKGEQLTINPAMSKEEPQWVQKVIKRFYGIRGPLDEYRRSKADEIGGLAFIYFFYFLLFANTAAFFLTVRFPDKVASYYPMVIALFSFVQLCIVSIRSLNADLPQYDLQEPSPKERRTHPLHPLRWGIVVTLLAILFSALSDLFNLNLPLLQSIFQIKSLFFGISMGIFTSLAISAFAYCQKLEADSTKKR